MLRLYCVTSCLWTPYQLTLINIWNMKYIMCIVMINIILESDIATPFYTSCESCDYHVQYIHVHKFHIPQCWKLLIEAVKSIQLKYNNENRRWDLINNSLEIDEGWLIITGWVCPDVANAWVASSSAEYEESIVCCCSRTWVESPDSGVGLWCKNSCSTLSSSLWICKSCSNCSREYVWFGTGGGSWGSACHDGRKLGGGGPTIGWI